MGKDYPYALVTKYRRAMNAKDVSTIRRATQDFWILISKTERQSRSNAAKQKTLEHDTPNETKHRTQPSTKPHHEAAPKVDRELNTARASNFDNVLWSSLFPNISPRIAATVVSAFDGATYDVENRAVLRWEEFESRMQQSNVSARLARVVLCALEKLGIIQLSAAEILVQDCRAVSDLDPHFSSIYRITKN